MNELDKIESDVIKMLIRNGYYELALKEKIKLYYQQQKP